MENITSKCIIALLSIALVATAAKCSVSEARSSRPGQPLLVLDQGSSLRNHSQGRTLLSANNKAILTINSFEKGGDGGGPSECDGHYHSNSIRIVALSTGWYNHGRRCHRNIIIKGNGKSTKAMVVDECDSKRGCAHNIVDGSRAVWEALGVHPNSNKWGSMEVTWSDA